MGKPTGRKNGRPKGRKQRIYWRNRGGVGRAYADLRDLGGKLEALKAPGEKQATSDPEVAATLLAARIKELAQRRQDKALGIQPIEGVRLLGEYSAYHLVEKKKLGQTSDAHMEELERRLEEAVAFFGNSRPIVSITAVDVQKWAAHLSKKRIVRSKADSNAGQLSTVDSSEGKDGKAKPERLYSPGTVRHYLNALSGLYRRAISEACVPPGTNPVAAMLNKPTARTEEARWLEVPDAALLIHSARLLPSRPIPFGDVLIATFLLTGGREAEVLGLEVDDISFDRNTIAFRPNQWRTLKTKTSRRVVPLWPQLAAILQTYIFDREAPLGSLLFPSPLIEEEQPITDVRKMLDAAAALAGWPKGSIRSKMFRHSYCAARLQTLDRGHPVSEYTIAREMGHGGFQMVRRIYGHLGQIRHRSNEVEYRVEQHGDVLGQRLQEVKARLITQRA